MLLVLMFFMLSVYYICQEYKKRKEYPLRSKSYFDQYLAHSIITGTMLIVIINIIVIKIMEHDMSFCSLLDKY